MTIIVMVLALAAWGSLPLGCLLIPETDNDVTFDWIQARYTYQDRAESESEEMRRTR